AESSRSSTSWPGRAGVRRNRWSWASVTPSEAAGTGPRTVTTERSCVVTALFARLSIQRPQAPHCRLLLPASGNLRPAEHKVDAGAPMHHNRRQALVDRRLDAEMA